MQCLQYPESAPGNEYGIDWDGPPPRGNCETDDLVRVPDTACPFTQDQVSALPRTYNMNYLDGVETFQQILNLMWTLVAHSIEVTIIVFGVHISYGSKFICILYTNIHRK